MAIVRWILKVDDYGMPPQVDYLTDAVMELAKNKGSRQVQVGSQPRTQTNLIGKNWITCFLNHHPELALKFVSHIDRQRAYAVNPCIIQTHFGKLEKVIRDNDIKDNGITNVDEKGFIMGISPQTCCIIKQGRKNPCIKQDGKREFITALDAVLADGFVFPSFLIAKGVKHRFNWYKNVHEEDKDAQFAVSKKGWMDNIMAIYWLTEVYDPISRERCLGPGKWLLILARHVSHINYTFLSWCETHGIIVFCLPPHSTHLLQPLDVGLFGPLQQHYRKADKDFFLTTSHSINWAIFFPINKQA